LLLTPFIVFIAWRLLAPAGGPPKVLVIALTATVAIMAGGLLWLWQGEIQEGHTAYVPARQENGRIIQGGQPEGTAR